MEKLKKELDQLKSKETDIRLHHSNYEETPRGLDIKVQKEYKQDYEETRRRIKELHGVINSLEKPKTPDEKQQKETNAEVPQKPTISESARRKARRSQQPGKEFGRMKLDLSEIKQEMERLNARQEAKTPDTGKTIAVKPVKSEKKPGFFRRLFGKKKK